MKTIALILCSFFLFNLANAQNFSLGATDVAGDATQALSPDAKAIYHAVDFSADSLWFKMEFYSRVDNISWSINIGLDTNNNVADGVGWPGQNHSMQFDLIATVFYNPAFPPPFTGYILDAAGTFVSSNITMQLSDTNVLILGFRLSEINPAASIHYCAGAGIILGAVNDDIPDATYITVASGSTGINKTWPESEIRFLKNLSSETLCFSFTGMLDDSPLKFEISDKQGRILEIDNFNTATHCIGIESLRPGMYFLRISGNHSISTKKFIRQ